MQNNLNQRCLKLWTYHWVQHGWADQPLHQLPQESRHMSRGELVEQDCCLFLVWLWLSIPWEYQGQFYDNGNVLIFTLRKCLRNIMWNICYTNWFNYLQGIKLDMMLTYYDMEEPWLLLNWTGLRSSFGGQLTVFRRKDLGLFTPTVGPWPRRGTGWRTTSLPCHHVRVRPESGGKTSQDLPGRWTLPTSTAQTRTCTASLNPLPPAVPNEMFVIWLQLLLLLPPGWGGHPPALELPIIL